MTLRLSTRLAAKLRSDDVRSATGWEQLLPDVRRSSSVQRQTGAVRRRVVDLASGTLPVTKEIEKRTCRWVELISYNWLRR